MLLSQTQTNTQKVKTLELLFLLLFLAKNETFMHKLQNRTSYSSIDNEWVPGEVVEGV